MNRWDIDVNINHFLMWEETNLLAIVTSAITFLPWATARRALPAVLPWVAFLTGAVWSNTLSRARWARSSLRSTKAWWAPSVWAAGTAPCPRTPWRGKCTHLCRSAAHHRGKEEAFPWCATSGGIAAVRVEWHQTYRTTHCPRMKM